MKKIILTSLAFISAIAINAQTTQTRDAKPFTQIEVSGAATVIYTQSDTLALSVSANESEINNVFTTFENNVLIIKAKGNFTHPYKVYVSANSLTKLTTTGASKFTTKNTLLCDSLSLKASGACDVNITTKSKIVDVMVSGASEVTLNGTSPTLYGNVSGASSLKAYKLTSDAVNVTASGASSAKVFSTQKINANATGSSSIKFKGEPTDVSAEASSSSTIAKVVGDDIAKKSGDGKDSTTINFRKKQFVIINKDKDSHTSFGRDNDNEGFKHWRGFGFGFNSFSSAPGSFALDKKSDNMQLHIGKSASFYFNPIQRNFNLYKNYINLCTGLGFQWNKYNFDKRVTLNADSSYTFGRIDSLSTLNYKTNALKSTYLNVPLLLEFNTNKNPEKAFHIAFGVIGGIKLGSRTKQEYTLNGNKINIERKDDYNLNFLRLNAHASVGYGHLAVFADYALTPLFEGGKGPELYPFTFGVRVIPF
jgi:Putative auto-transporter adhesin, head GIN domain/Outer membrane protein beta-barrel domain